MKNGSASALIWAKSWLLVSVVALLAACGGGDGSANSGDVNNGNSPPPSLQEQSLTFSDSGSVTLYVGEARSNPATGLGGGAVSYSSSDESVARVDSRGLLMAVGAGNVYVTASIVADSQYGSASARYSVNVLLRNNALSFVRPGPIKLPVGESLVNPAIGLGNSPISYRSSDTAVATVDANGGVTAQTFGSVTISAVQQMDGEFLEANASYDLKTSFSMKAWAGVQDTLISFPFTADGMALYRSSEKDCDVDNFQSCDNGQMDVISTAVLKDTSATLEQPGYYVLKNKAQQVRVSAWPHHLAPRSSTRVVVYQGKLWRFGVDWNNPSETAWVSEDGILWERVKSNFPLDRRWHQLVSHDGKLFLIGGDGWGIGYNLKNDIWISDNGRDWQKIVENAEFEPRIGHSVVSFDGKLWLIGGWNPACDECGAYSDVWSSEDGATWVRELEAAPFPVQIDPRVVSHDGRLWLFDSYYGDQVWSSKDGLNWGLVNDSVPVSDGWSGGSTEGVAVHNGKLWLVKRGDFESDGIWSSSDGVIWEKAETGTFKVEAESTALASFAGRLWIIGGKKTDGTSRLVDSLWSSVEGTSWEKWSPQRPLPDSAGLPDTRPLRVAAHRGSFWFFDRNRLSEDGRAVLWSSRDGLEWRARETEGGPRELKFHQLFQFRERLWLIAEDREMSEGGIWSSEDGDLWRQETEAAAFSHLSGLRVIVHEGKLWLFGQAEDTPDIWGNPKNEVWSSPDGVHWERVLDEAGFSPQSDYEVASFHGMLWVIGGKHANTEAGYQAGVWGSRDGRVWNPAEPWYLFFGRRGHRLAVHDSRLWLVGGENEHDIWTSTDGAAWSQISSTPPFSLRHNHGLLSLNDALWLIGGAHRFDQWRDVWKFTEKDGWRTGYEREFIAQ